MPSSSFLVTLNSDLSNVTGDGTAYFIPFDNAISNVGSDYNTSTGAYTAPADGLYQFNASVLMQNMNAESYTDMNVYFKRLRNSSVLDYYFVGYRTGSYNGSYEGQSGSITIPMLAGDEIYVQVAVSGGTKIADVNSSSHFSGFIFD